jgi:sugar lactone lactonase YvrE
MKNLILNLAVASTLTASAFAQSHQLVKKWETEPSLKTPESVLFDGGARVLYVSNIDGKQPWTKDGKGSIAKVGLDGKVIAAEWVTGLEAPKGLGLHQGRLYVADMDRVVVIDVAKGVIVEKIAIEGVKGLNDVTVDAAGTVYVSDSQGGGKVYAISQGKSSVFLDNLKNPNGVLAHGKDFYVLDSGTMFKVGKDKSLTKIVDGMEGSTDGIEHVQGDEFIVSCWNGVIYYVKGGEKQQLLDTRAQKSHTADIGYDAKNRIVYVPTFFANTVVAYEVK